MKTMTTFRKMKMKIIKSTYNPKMNLRQLTSNNKFRRKKSSLMVMKKKRTNIRLKRLKTTR